MRTQKRRKFSPTGIMRTQKRRKFSPNGIMENTFSNRLQSTTEESTAKDGTEPFLQNERNIFFEISKRLPFDKFQMFGTALGLETNVIMELERECNVYSYGSNFKIIRMLEKWKSINNPDEDRLVSSLVEALKNIQCNDIADTIEKGKLIGHHQECSQLLNAIQKLLVEYLLKKFGALQLPRFVWLRQKLLPLDELFVEPSMKRKDKWGKEEEKQIDKEKIFIEEDKKIPRRILIESHSGYGKTTLLAKFLYDWSREEKYICDRFDLVFVIPLRDYEGNVSLQMLQLCEEVKGSFQEKILLQAIEAIEERVLVLLDGLDEIPTGAMETLLPLLRGAKHPKMTVVVTCRTGFAKLKTKPDHVLGKMGISDSAEPCIWDRRVQIKGISLEKRQEFLQKYLDVDDEKLKEKLSQINLELNDLYQCPLFLLLLASLIEKKDNRPVITKTNLYKRIFNFVINRSLEKLKGQKKGFDVFNLKRESDYFGIRNLLKNFGRLCLEKIKTQSLFFEKSELLKCSDRNGEENMILNLGILSKQTSFSIHEEKEFYEPIHKSFLEFLAAFFISSLDEEIRFESEIQKLLLKCNIWPNEDGLLYMFLGGFLQSNAFMLFKAFSPYKSIISIFKDNKNYLYNVQNILLEISPSKKIINSLEYLSIGNWQRVTCEESFHSWFVGFLKYSEKRSDISLLIPQHLYIFNNLPHGVKIKTIQVNCRDEKFKLRVRNVQCENLIITIEDGIYKESEKILKEIMFKIKAEKTWLKVSYPYFQEKKGFKPTGDFIDLFTKLIKGKRFQNVHFSYLSLNDIPPSFFSSISTSIQDLIKNQKIHYGINVQLSEDRENDSNDSFREKFDSFERIVCDSQLKSFGVDNSFFKIPLSFPQVFYNEEKEMHFIGMIGSFEGIKMDKVKSFSAKQFYCIKLKLDQKSFISELLLKVKKSERLACEGDLISDLGSCNTIPEWKGLKNIQRLDLNLGTVQDKDLFLSGISRFNNLQEINLIGLKKHKLLIEIISHLPSLKRICYSSESNFLKKFLKRLLSLQDEKNKEFNFDELEVKLKTDDSSKFLSNDSFIKRVEKCFVKHVFNKFSIMHCSTLHMENLLKYFISKNKFKISSQWIEEPRHHGISDLVHSKLNLDEIPQLKHRQSIYVENKETM